MRTRVRYNLYTKTKKQFVSVTASLVLALASIGGSVPLFLSQKAFAVSPDYGTGIAFNAAEVANWHADRATPSGGYSSTSYAGRDNVLKMNIDNGNANSDDVFSQTEGLQRSLPSQSESIKASLYVDGDHWDGKQVRAGLWGVGHTADSSDASAFPIIEYTTVGDDGFVGWRVWDSVNGGWTNLDEVDASTGWHDLAISLNKNKHDFGVFVDGSYVGDTPADDGETDVTDSLSAVILNSRNFATHNPDDNYSVHWSDFGYGDFPSTAPQTVYVDSDAYDTTAPFVNGNMVGYDAFSSLQAGIDAVAAGGTVEVSAGDYNEDITINKAVTVVGPNAALNPNTQGTDDEAVITGQVSIYAGDVSLKGFTITNPDWNGATIKGVHVYGGGTNAISNITLENNVITDVHNAAAHGAYGVMVQGVTNNVTITNNAFSDITSAGWAHAIEVTPTGSNPIVPQHTVITGNVITGTANASGHDQYDMSVDFSGSVAANASQVTFTGNSVSGNVRNIDPSHTFDASKNWWGQVTGPTATQHSGLMTIAPWCDNADCSSYTSGETISLQPTNGVAQSPNVIVTLKGAAGAGNVQAVIPENTTITSNPNWDGTIKVPTTTSFTVPGATSTGLAISVGSDDYSLVFSQPVQLYFPGQAGKAVGFKAPGGVFTPITATCNVNDPSVQLIAPTNECKMDMGTDLVVWTKHFTTFATYTPASTTTPATTSSSKGTSTKTTTTKSTGHPVGGVATTTGISNVIAEVLGSSNGIKATTTKAAKAPVTHTATATTTNDRFLGLGWYWFVVLAVMVLGTFGYYRLMVVADRD